MLENKPLYQVNSKNSGFSAILGAIAIILMIFIAINLIINNIFCYKIVINGASMEPTFYSNEVVLASKNVRPDYGSVIIITGEKSNGDWLIKRAIGFGGDTVKIEGGYVYIKKSGEKEFTKLNEPYLREEGITFYPDVKKHSDTEKAEFIIEEGQVFYLGDNRTNSSDSRSHFSTCKESQVVGVVTDFAIKIKGITTFFEKITLPIKKLLGTA